MNLDQIATKCFILALFIRDDGERLLLGDGFYDFKSNLQHFQANTIANDVVEIQGDNGQLLAGQVMRSGAQKFEGYIGDATTNRQTIEQKRSDFMAFFRIKHFYQVIYILPDGTAIQRRRGYLTDAPAVPEIFQKFPEYSVALNFEDANYYEYAEDEHGDEIYAHIAELALAGGATGGLVWDAIGAVTNGITWSGIQTAQGEYIQITNDLDIPAKLASVEMLGNAEQDGTPTPDAPVAVETTTGEQTVKIEGKNLFDYASASDTANTFVSTYRLFKLEGLLPNTQYTLSGMTFSSTSDMTGKYLYIWSGDTYATREPSVFIADGGNVSASKTFTTSGTGTYYLAVYPTDATTWSNVLSFLQNAQLELGSTATTYEPYQGQSYEINLPMLGKNKFRTSMLPETWNNNTAISVPLSLKPNTTYTMSSTIGRADGDAAIFFKTASASIGTNTNGVWSGQSRTATTDATGDNLVIVYRTLNSAQYRRDDYTYQIEEGSSATTYEAPNPLELAKIGTYQDRIYKTGGKWYIEKQVGKVVFDGTENWTNQGGGAPYTIDMPDFDRYANEVRAISDNFLGVKYNDNWNNYSSLITSNSSSDPVSRFKFRYTAITSLNDWKTWLSTHPTTVYYALATPTTTEITNEALIAQLDALGASSLYLGVNNIGTETLNAVPTLKIEYYTEVDLDGAGYEWEPGGNTAKTIVTVAGVDSAWPIWTVQGGAQNPTLTNITTGQTITWQGFVPAGQTLTINMAEMTADLAGANVFEYITGEWIRLAPGNNTLVYTAGSADKPSTLSWNGVLA